MSEPLWLRFTGQQPKRKRAELACIACRSKKIRCDIQTRGGQGHKDCTKCAASGKECRTRPSRRGRSSRTTGPLSPPESNDNDQSNSTQSHTNCEMGRANATGNQVHNQTSNIDREQHIGQNHNFSQLLLQSSSGSLVSQGQSLGGGIDDWVSAEFPADPSLNSPHLQQGTHAVTNDSPATQRSERTEDHSEHNDSYPVGHVFLPELQTNARDQERLLAERRPDLPRLPEPALQESFAETYFEYCYPWCPVLERDDLHDDLAQSPLLVNALAAAASNVNSPILPHDGPAVYYERARSGFYNDEEADVMTSLKAISLFYWWSPRPPTILHRHSSWWWTSVVIRHCQQLGVHREPGPDHPLRHQIDLSLRRRIWWTAFARERLTALCQNKPCVIDPDDCTLSEPTLADFPNSQNKEKAEVFIYWVRLCAIVGKVAKYLARTCDLPSCAFPVDLARELIDWVQSLPQHLQLPIGASRTTSFNRDVYQLHLPYLAVIIIIHLKRSTSSQPLPQAYPPAILAATCMARLMRDILARGDTRFLMAISGWYCGTAFIALLQTLRVESLAKSANEDLDILTLAVDQLRKMWPTAAVFYSGFERLRSNTVAPDVDSQRPPGPELGMGDGSSYMEMTDGIDWTAYFPFATSQTSGIASRLLVPDTEELFFDDGIFADAMLQFQGLFESCDTLSDMNWLV